MRNIVLMGLIIVVLFLIYLAVFIVALIIKGKTKDNYTISQKLARQYRNKLFEALKS